MDDNWIEQKAKEAQGHEDAVQKERAWRFHVHEALRHRGQEAIDGLKRAVRLDIAEWNAKFPDDPYRLVQVHMEVGVPSFAVRRTYYPSFTLHVKYHPEGQSISSQYSKSRAPGAHAVERTEIFRLTLGKDDNVYLVHRGAVISSEDASRILLQDLL